MVTGRKSWLWMIPVLVFVTWLGARNLTTEPIWYDEWYSLYYAGAAPQYGPIPLPTTWARVAEDNDPQPPGYYTLLNLWGNLTGWTPYATRTLSLLLGILALAGIYRAGCDFSSPVAGFGASLALGASAFFVHHLPEIRMYTLYPLLTIALLWTYWRLVHVRKTQNGLIVLFVVSLAGLLYTHYLSIPLVASLGLYHILLINKIKWSRWTQTLLWALVGILLFLPWAVIGLHAFTKVSEDGGRRFFAQDTFSIVRNLLIQFSNGNIALLAVFVWYALRGQAHSRGMVVFVAVFTLLFTLLINAVSGFVTTARYLMALWPLLAIIVGLGVASMSRQKLYPAVALTAWIAGGLWLIVPGQIIQENDKGGAAPWPLYQAWERLGEVIQPHFQEKDHLVYFLPDLAAAWFYAPVANYYLMDFRANVEPMPDWIHSNIFPHDKNGLQVTLVESLYGKSPEDFRGEAENFVSGVSRAWLAYNPSYLSSPFARPEFEAVLNSHGFLACDNLLAESDLQVDLYVRLNEPPPGVIHFNDNLDVEVLGDIPEPTRGSLPLLIGSQHGGDLPSNTYSIGIHVDNSAGQLVAQTDFGLPSQAQNCHLASILIDTLSPGDYTLHLVVYAWQTGERLVGKDTGDNTSDRPLLGHFTIR
jgi:hypothetical protein